MMSPKQAFVPSKNRLRQRHLFSLLLSLVNSFRKRRACIILLWLKMLVRAGKLRRSLPGLHRRRAPALYLDPQSPTNFHDGPVSFGFFGATTHSLLAGEPSKLFLRNVVRQDKLARLCRFPAPAVHGGTQDER